jgi:hypothetical protein
MKLFNVEFHQPGLGTVPDTELALVIDCMKHPLFHLASKNYRFIEHSSTSWHWGFESISEESLPLVQARCATSCICITLPPLNMFVSSPSGSPVGHVQIPHSCNGPHVIRCRHVNGGTYTISMRSNGLGILVHKPRLGC